MINRSQQLSNQLMWNRLLSVVEEQAQTLIRTAFSPIVRECGDISAGIFDLEGRMMAQAVTGTPGHVNSMAESVKHFMKFFPIKEMNEGDIYITNDPWMGTGHLNDFVLTTPCFKNNKIVEKPTIENTDKVHTVGPEYAFPEVFADYCDFKPKMVHMAKDNSNYHV